MDVAECDGVGADTESWTPFFGDGFGEAYDAGFLETKSAWKGSGRGDGRTARA